MKSIVVTRIKLLSFIKLTAATGVAMGWFLGVLSLLASIFGGNPTANIFGLEFSGIAAGLVNVVWVPVIFSVGFGLLSIAAFWPFLWLLRCLGGLRIDLTGSDAAIQR